MEKPSISLCMIVKNEEPYLAACLSSVREVVDEIIVVDTGSTDRTVAIARDYGATVIERPWDDSFSNARNRGMEEAAGEWILWLDADEVLDLHDAPRLKELLSRDAIARQQIEGIQLLFHNYTDGGYMECTYLLRMVRNRPAYRFEGRIHEQILPVMLQHTPNCKLGMVDVKVHHYGNLTRNVIRQRKSERNISLLRKALTEHPQHYEYHYYLGIELLGANEPEEALSHFNTALDHPQGFTLPVIVNAHKYRLMALDALQRYEDLAQYSSDSITRYPAFTDLYHYKAKGLMALGNTDQAIHVLMEALHIGPAPEEYPTIAGHGSYLTCIALGRCMEAVGKVIEADLYYTLASLKDHDRIAAVHRFFTVGAGAIGITGSTGDPYL